jgi:hypothetical protein
MSLACARATVLCALVLALAAALAAAASHDEAGDGTSSFGDAFALTDGDTYAGHLDRVGDKADYFRLCALQGTVIDAHIHVTGHDGTTEWTAPSVATPPAPPSGPYPSCMLGCYLCAGKNVTLAIDGAYNFPYIRHYCLSAVAPVAGTATYYVEVSIDWRWTPNNYTWDYSLDLRLSRPVELTPGVPVTGKVDLDLKDTHWFTIAASAGEEVNGSLEVLNFDPARPTDRNLDIWVFPDDMGGWPRATAWDWSAAPNEPIEPFSILATYDGWYIIKLRGMNHDLNLPCSYRFLVDVSPVPDFPDGQVVSGYFDRQRHDTDWFRFTMRANMPRAGEPGLWNELQMFNMTERAVSEDLPDFDLYLFGLVPGARELDLLDSSFRGDHESFGDPDRDPARPWEEVRGAAFYNGSYYVEVNGYKNAGFYDLRNEKWSSTLSDENNLAIDATPIMAGIYEDHVHQAVDHNDWYRLETNGWYRVNLMYLPLSGIFNLSFYRHDYIADSWRFIVGGSNIVYDSTSRQGRLTSSIDLSVDLAELGLGQGSYWICVCAVVGAETGVDNLGRPFVYITDTGAYATSYEMAVWTDVHRPPPPPPRAIPDLVLDEDTDRPGEEYLYDHFSDTDVGGPGLRFKATVISGKLLRLIIENDTLGFLAYPDYVGKVLVKVRAQDRHYLETSLTWCITFLPVNDAPRLRVVEPFTIDMVEEIGTDINMAALFKNVDQDDALTFDAVGTTNMSASLHDDGSWLQLLPAPDWFGEEELVVTATDLAGASCPLRLRVVVTNTEDAPRLVEPIGPVVMDEDTVALIDLYAHFVDPDRLPLAFEVVADPSLWASVDPTTGALGLSPATNWNGYVQATVTAIDAAGLKVFDTFWVRVTQVPDPPSLDLLTPDTPVVDIDEGGSQAFAVLAMSDPDLNCAKIEWQLDGRLVAGGPFYLYEASYTDAGEHTLGVTLTDAECLTDEWTWTVRVKDVPRAPVGGIASPTEGASYPEGSRIPFVAIVMDPDGNVVALQWYVDGTPYGPSASFEERLAEGAHDTTLVATSDGLSLEDDVNFTVEPVRRPIPWFALAAGCAAMTGGAAVVAAALAAVRSRRRR